ncbi:MAG: hypothetical protein IKD72_01305 [Clostridia bacterium]|nr:hypothetical protein [Clostridia bacterium]
MTRLFSLLLGLWTALQLALPGLVYGFCPTLKIDADAPVAPVTNRASGFLYGLAQAGVPDPLMVESLDLASVSQKVLGGLQHPIGDVDEVAPNLDSCDYITVYLNDVYSTWYYDEGNIRALRKAGDYDSAAYVREDYLPRIAETVRQLGQTPYADRLVYCLFNEMDNGVWFGTPNAENPDWLMFDDAAKERFYAAWEETFRFVRSIVPEARIGGPGNCVYDSANIRAFLAYCKAHACLPDVMIYHELAADSTYYWQDHYDDYRATEQALGLDPLPIIVTEIGTMEECGAPAKMLNYIVAAETTGVYTNAAYWRLANNLCDTAADATVPNSNWWLYRWYADLEGHRLRADVLDVTHADFENTIKYGFKRFHQRGITGMAALNDARDRIDVIAGGEVEEACVQLTHLNRTNLGSKVRVRIEYVMFEGLSGAVHAPVLLEEYTAQPFAGRLKIQLSEPDPTAVYHVTVTPDTGAPAIRGNARPQRVEFETGERAGGCYTYDSAYATTGETAGMVGGLERDGDSVTIRFHTDENTYDLKFIYGKANDGRTPADRVDGAALLTIDGETSVLTLPNTIRSEYTDTLTVTKALRAGTHTLTLAHKDGTFVVDSLILTPHREHAPLTLLPDADRTAPGTTAFLAVAPDDGFYALTADRACAFTIDGARGQTANDGTATVALRRGLNLLLLQGDGLTCTVVPTAAQGAQQTILPAELTLTAPARLAENERGVYLTGISSEGGAGAFTVDAPANGDYRMTVAYANNAEGGVHSYNVDLIEQYLTVTVNGGAPQDLWCRNTSSWQTVKTATCNLTLTAGENVVTLTNDGLHRFNGQPAEIPHVYSVTLRPVCS